jgi:hypothetical protein
MKHTQPLIFLPFMNFLDELHGVFPLEIVKLINWPTTNKCIFYCQKNAGVLGKGFKTKIVFLTFYF